MQTMFYVQYSAGLDVGFEQWQLTIEGKLSVPDYRRAWEHVVAQHEALRTAFQSKGLSQPCQVVVQDAVLPWHEEHLDNHQESEQARIIDAYVSADRARRFDLSEAPLMRLAMFRLGADRWHVVWTFHHLVIDGWSCPIIMADLAQAYAGGPPTPPASSFKQFVHWQAANSAGHESYWREALAGVSSPTPLPYGADSRARHAAPAEWRTTIPESIVNRLVVGARRQRVTLGALFQAAWAVTLSGISGRDDVVFGLTMSGRPPEIQVENTVGTFVNNVPIRIGVSQSQPAARVMTSLQARVNEVAEHQFLAPSRIHELSGIATHERVFDSLLIVQNYAGAEAPRRVGAHARIVRLDAPIRTGYPVTVVVTPGSDIAVTLIVRDRSWSESMGQAVLDAFVGLTTTLLDAAGKSVGEVLGGFRGLPKAEAAPPLSGGGSATFVQPRTALEAEITAVWQTVFGHSRFGVDANFFDLGGHSLLMIKAHEALQHRLSRTLSIVDLFEHPTIGALAKHLAGDLQDSRVRAAKSRAQMQLEAMARQKRRGGTS
jgi:hypothetical protein